MGLGLVILQVGAKESARIDFCLGDGYRAAMWVVIASCLGGWTEKLHDWVSHWGHDPRILDQDVSFPCLFEKVDSGSPALWQVCIMGMGQGSLLISASLYALPAADNKFAKFLMTCLKCCFWCLEKFIRFLNRNAYIMVSRPET